MEAQSVGTVERAVMTSLFWPADPTLPAVHPSERWIVELKERVSAAVTATLDPLQVRCGQRSRVLVSHNAAPPLTRQAYLASLQSYSEFINMDIDAYVASRSKGGAFNVDELHVGAAGVTCVSMRGS